MADLCSYVMFFGLRMKFIFRYAAVMLQQ